MLEEPWSSICAEKLSNNGPTGEGQSFDIGYPLSLARPVVAWLLTVHKVTLLNLVLPEIVWPLAILTRTAWVGTPIYFGDVSMLQLLVLGHAAAKPSRVAAWSIATYITAAI